MSHLTKQNQHFFNFLTTCSPRQKQLLLDTLTPKQVHALCEVTYHILRGRFPLQKHELEVMKESRKNLHALAKGSVPYKEKRKILVQHGAGFVDELLKPVLSALAYVIL